MKRLLIFVMLVLIQSCGSVEADLPQQVVEPHGETPAAQPFAFQKVGEEIPGMLVALKQLPSGKWLVASRFGDIFLTTADFKILGSHHAATVTSNDSGLMDIEVIGRSAYVYRTLLDENGECPEILCSILVRFEIDEASSDPLKNPEEIARFAMMDDSSHHQGGGMAVVDGQLYLGVGDGTFMDDFKDSPAQDMTSPLGKVYKMNPSTDELEIVALGFRNPFTLTAIPGGVVIGDVGMDDFEELDFLPSSAGLTNYGWPVEEGPGSRFTSPIHAVKHCVEEFIDEDPYDHQIKNHNGVVHQCDDQVLVVAGFRDKEIIYGELYYGYIRGFNPKTGEDRHLAHFPGLTALERGLDGNYYGVSLFASNFVLRMVSGNGQN